MGAGGIASIPRPLTSVKILWRGRGRIRLNLDGMDRWWRHLIGGAAAMRFHRPDRVLA